MGVILKATRNMRHLCSWKGCIYFLLILLPTLLFWLFSFHHSVHVYIQSTYVDQQPTQMDSLRNVQATQNPANSDTPTTLVEAKTTTLVEAKTTTLVEAKTTTLGAATTTTTQGNSNATQTSQAPKTDKRPKLNCSTIPDELVCEPHQPCMYEDEVDLRVLVVVYDRSESLRKALNRLQKLELDGDTAKMEIWLDCSKDGYADKTTYDVAKNFNWTKGSSRVHVWKSHVGIYGQFTDTWTPHNGTKEISLMVEDDVDMAPMAWRWLKAARKRYDPVPRIAGYALCERVKKSPKNTTVFLLRHTETWGFSPKADVFADFQRWFYTVRKDKDFHPYIKEDKMRSGWFKKFEKNESMWTMWFHYYIYMKKIYMINPNLKDITGKEKKVLDINREEKGLHYNGKVGEAILKKEHLLDTWSDQYVQFPDFIPILNYNTAYYATLNTLNNTVTK